MSGQYILGRMQLHMNELTEKQVRNEYQEHRKDPTFAECWPDTDRAFYEWCSQYLDYKHVKQKDA